MHTSARFFPSRAIIDKQHLTGFKTVISCILKAAAPANSAKSDNYAKSQIAYSIYDGRYKAAKPRTSIAPPIQLFHPAFGHFLDIVERDFAPPDDIVRKTTDYMTAASAIYGSEQERRNVLTPLLCTILDVNIQAILNEDRTNADSIVEVANGTLISLIFLQELKNEFGDGGSDPSTQTGLSVGRCWAQPRVCQIHTVLCFDYSFVYSLV